MEGFRPLHVKRYVSQHGLTTAMQHLLEIGKILRGLSD